MRGGDACLPTMANLTMQEFMLNLQTEDSNNEGASKERYEQKRPHLPINPRSNTIKMYSIRLG
ncbi:hypothetical protein ABB05_01370 [Lederbergia galactosidilytica]|uniref:Uncharacterized protein n=1 Tax=Lederbergia galactosidilytica TaxID=217031 RepID=A0A178A678_9BACI|nr:hypothetical protein ABB05_01370 [Lederbergia galactosidilytica]